MVMLHKIHWSSVMWCSCLDPLVSLSFPVLAAVARMSYKYHIPHLLEEAIQKMKPTFPKKINLGALRCADIQTHAIEAVNLFHILDLPGMLVTALYACCQIPSSSVASGAAPVDGTIELLAPADVEICWKLHQ